MKTKTGSQLISAERRRQIKVEGWTAEHDDIEHVEGDLALAAICYAAPVPIFVRFDFADHTVYQDPWPWDQEWDRRPYDGNVLTKPTRRQRLRLLVKAGALLAAEIDRMQRISKSTK